MVYFGFAVADSMFHESATAKREALSFEECRAALQGGDVVCVVNAAHQTTIDAMRARGLRVAVPSSPPKVRLSVGDEFIVASHDLPRLEGRREYTSEEVGAATFRFGRWTVLA